MNRMACSEAWAAMKACFVFMSSSPIERKKPRLCVEPQPPPSAACYPGEAAPVQRPSAFCGAVAAAEPAASSSILQLRWGDAELGSHTAMRRTRLRQPGNRLFLVFRRKSQPRLLCPSRSVFNLPPGPGSGSNVNASSAHWNADPPLLASVVDPVLGSPKALSPC